VDGSYNGGKDSDMDRMIDERLREASNQMGRIDPASVRQTVDTKAALLAALRNIKCDCGDKITIFMMGHGTNNKFIFSKGRGSSQRELTADELRDALEAAAIACCCKINVVIFACHSGSMIDELTEGEHIKSVLTSCASNECSYSNTYYEDERTFTDEGDWMKGFNEDMAAVGRGTSMVEAVEIANRSAREKIPTTFLGRQTPQGWVKGEHEVVAHVEGRPETRNGRTRVRVTYYQPEWLRGRTGYIYLGENSYPDGLKHCDWISGNATFGRPDEDVNFTGPVTRTDAPHETILAHIEGGGQVHIASPTWQFCRNVRMNVTREQIEGQSLQRCTWICQDVTVNDPACGGRAGEFDNDGTGRSDSGDDVTANGPVRPCTPSFRVKVHVDGYNPESGNMSITLLDLVNREGQNIPNWLARYGTYRNINIPQAERTRLRNVKKCQNIWIDLIMPLNPDDTPTGRNARIVHHDFVRPYSVDVSLNYITRPELSLVSTVTPEIILTNVGEETVSFPVDAFIVTPENAGSLNTILLSEKKQIIKDYKTGITDFTGFHNRRFVADLPPGQSARVSFEPCLVKKGVEYILAVKTLLEPDEVDENDTLSLKFIFKEEEDMNQVGDLLIKASGTGMTTGHIATLTVINPTDNPLYAVIGPYMIPSTGQFQGYIVPHPQDVTVDSGDTIMVALYGYCTDINLPPVSNSDDMPGIDIWVNPQNMGPVPLPGYTGIDTTIFRPFKPKPEDGMVLTYPGSETPFPYKIDIDSFPEMAAPLLFDAIERIEDAYISLSDEQKIITPFSGKPERESETVIQQSFWIYAEALEGTPYTREDFTGKLEEQFKESTGMLIGEASEEQQSQFDQGAGQFWDTFELVGERAKILKKTEKTE